MPAALRQGAGAPADKSDVPLALEEDLPVPPAPKDGLAVASGWTRRRSRRRRPSRPPESGVANERGGDSGAAPQSAPAALFRSVGCSVVVR